MADPITEIAFEAGYIVVTSRPGGTPKRWAIADILRAADIPVGLTHTQVASISTLANLIVVLIRTLIDREVLDESFLENDDYDLDALIETIAAMGGSYGEPDLTVS